MGIGEPLLLAWSTYSLEMEVLVLIGGVSCSPTVDRRSVL